MTDRLDAINEPVFTYAPGTPERASLQSQLEAQSRTQVEIPLVIGGQRVMTSNHAPVAAPFDHRTSLAQLHQADASHVQQAIAAATMNALRCS